MKTAESEAKETELKTSERKQPEKEKVSDKLSRFWNRCKKIVGSILKFPGKLKKKLTNIRLTFRGFCDKIKRWRTLWNEDSTQAALRFLTEKGRKTHETLQSVIDGLDKQLVRGIEKEDIEIFLSVVEKIRKNIEQECKKKE